jgi:peroxiredoxin
MHTTLYLVASVLATAQAPVDPADGSLQPRLGRGQELLYRGSFTEEAKGQSVQFSHALKVETRVFVLDVMPQGTDVAFMTVCKGQPARPEGKIEADPTAVRLETARVDPQGRIKHGAGVSLAVPLDGPPTVECGVFVDAPRGRIQPEQTWETADGDRPPRSWTVAGFENMGGVRCLKLIGTQQSDDWERPRADHTAWHRVDTVWMTPKAGYATKVERVIERREPARKEANLRSVLRYELESSIQFPGPLFEDRRRDIQQVQALTESVNALLPRAGDIGPKPFEALLKRIDYHTQQYPPTPYRDALKRVQRLAEAGKRGEVPMEKPAEEAPPVSNVISLGKPAPDFLVGDLVTGNSVRLRRWLGRPILLVFYSPNSASADAVLHFAQKTLEGNSEQVVVLGLAVSDDTEKVLKQRASLRLTFPLLSGTGLRLSYAVEATPKLVVLDAAGLVRGSYIGWGPEIPRSVCEDLKKCRMPGQP